MVIPPMKSVMGWFGRVLDEGWFPMALLIFQFWLAYWMLAWSMAFASTALAAKAQAVAGTGAAGIDLLNVAAVITAVAAVPQALLVMATKIYMDMRSQRPVMVADRRK